jgi:NAD(P)-dependent dehydrogenase (short-subunit alcohol dehydrogenase family)
MQINLKGHRAVVSGSTGGIGFAIAAGLASAGADVVVNGRTQESADEAAEKLRRLAPGVRIDPIGADLSSAAGVDAFVGRAGDADILVNNLGIFEMKPFDQISDADWTRFFESNVMSGVRLSRHYFPSMLAKDWGRIIFISSESALNIPGEMIHYGMSKTAQLSVSRGLAELTAGTGVTVNAVLPGPTHSRAVGQMLGRVAAAKGVTEEEAGAGFIAAARPSSLLKRLATPEEVANMVVYLVSPQASATNGAALRVDGGVVRSIA